MNDENVSSFQTARNILTLYLNRVRMKLQLKNKPYSPLGHPNKMFRFPSPSDSKGLAGRSEKKKLKLKIIFQSNTIPLN